MPVGCVLITNAFFQDKKLFEKYVGDESGMKLMSKELKTIKVES